MGYLADKIGRQNTTVATLFLSALTVFTLWLETWDTFISFCTPISLSPKPLLHPFPLLSTMYSCSWSSQPFMSDLTGSRYLCRYIRRLQRPPSHDPRRNLRPYSSVNGFLYSILGCGAFMGTPVYGLLLATQGYGGSRTTDYRRIIVFHGSLLVGSAVSVGLVRVSFPE